MQVLVLVRTGLQLQSSDSEGAFWNHLHSFLSSRILSLTHVYSLEVSDFSPCEKYIVTSAFLIL